MGSRDGMQGRGRKQRTRDRQTNGRMEPMEMNSFFSLEPHPRLLRASARRTRWLCACAQPRFFGSPRFGFPSLTHSFIRSFLPSSLPRYSHRNTHSPPFSSRNILHLPCLHLAPFPRPGFKRASPLNPGSTS